MRIVGGRFRGRRLSTPAGMETRPTSDRARQAVFNVLEHAAWSPGVADARVLDLFAGSGALGLEALSRGAAYCLFVDTAEAARGAIRDNVEALGLRGEARVHRRDAADLGRRSDDDGAPFALAFLDPPYGKRLGERALMTLSEGDWLAPGAICVREQPAETVSVDPVGFERLDTRRYGAAELSFLRFEPSE